MTMLKDRRDEVNIIENTSLKKNRVGCTESCNTYIYIYI